jgi:hypothetical protein
VAVPCFNTSLVVISWLSLTAGCGARSALEDGPGSGPEGGAGAGANGSGADGAGAGLSNYDPDVECPVAGCAGDQDCPPAVLTAGRPIGWATIDGGDLYFTTNDPEGDNVLIRVPVCGGEEQVLLERERFAGDGAIAGDDLYIPVEEPTREVVRMPKIGGAATAIHTHEAGDPYTTRAVTVAAGYALLSQYSFDGGLVLKEVNPKGKARALQGNLSDADWFLVTSVASGFLPNRPVFFQPENGDAYAAYLGSDFGVFRVSPFNALAEPPVFVSAYNVEVPVIGPLLIKSSKETDPTVYFSSNQDFGPPNQFKLANGVLENILPEMSDGIMLALDDGQIFGSGNDFYMDDYEDDEFGGGIWQAAEGDAYAEGVSSTRFQNALALEIHGKSVYVRTTRAVVRFPKDCKVGEDRCRFYYEE